MAPTAAVTEARANDKSEDISGAGTSYSSNPNNRSSANNPLDTNPATTQADLSDLEEPLEWEIEMIGQHGLGRILHRSLTFINNKKSMKTPKD